MTGHQRIQHFLPVLSDLTLNLCCTILQSKLVLPPLHRACPTDLDGVTVLGGEFWSVVGPVCDDSLVGFMDILEFCQFSVELALKHSGDGGEAVSGVGGNDCGDGGGIFGVCVVAHDVGSLGVWMCKEKVCADICMYVCVCMCGCEVKNGEEKTREERSKSKKFRHQYGLLNVWSITMFLLK